jgi:hypothetical protein
MLRSRTKEDAARIAGISSATMYRWPPRASWPRFGRRQVFDDALFVRERNALGAAQTLADEFGPGRTGEDARMLDRAFKGQGNIAVEEELAEVRANMERLKAGPPVPPVIVEKVVKVKRGITAQEQAEACRLRMEWMGELGHPLEDITTSASRLDRG